MCVTKFMNTGAYSCGKRGGFVLRLQPSLTAATEQDRTRPFGESGVPVSLWSPHRSSACTSSRSRTGRGRSAQPWEHCAEAGA